MSLINQSKNAFANEWKRFVKFERLSEKQTEQFLHYMELLREASMQINLTTILDPEAIVAHHFRDSLRLREAMDLTKINTISDVGTGGGFPGIPLKIIFPHLKLILIEVNKKKISFLESVIHGLGLEDVEISALDWRTFLRQTKFDIDVFCARASLSTEELVRVFKPSSRYNKAKLVYWASSNWVPEKKAEPFVIDEHLYHISNKRRRLIIFGQKS